MDELIGELRELCAIEGRTLTVGERARTKIAMSEAAAALEAAREDAERLDWMDIHRGDDVRQDPHSGDPVLVAHYWAIAGQCTDIRAAIDQARGKGGGEVEGG